MKKIKERSPYLYIGFAMLFTIIILALLAPLISKFSYEALDLYNINAAPSKLHPLGTDDLGRDVLSRLLYGTRVSIAVGIICTLSQILIGMTIGVVSGYLGGVTDFIIMRIIDVIMCFPFLLVAIAITTMIGPSLFNLIIIITVLSWIDVARIVRGETLKIKNENFITASKITGFKGFYIIRKHIIPNVMPSVIVSATLSMATTILMESALSFLGLGVKDPMPSLGNMLSSARNIRALRSYWWTWLPAGIMIILCVLSINFIGEGIRNKYKIKDNKKKKIEIIKDIDLEIEKGKITALVGESGSGKTLLAHSITGLAKDNIKAEGRVIFKGENLLALDKKKYTKMRGKDISIIFQDSMNSLNPLQTVGKQIGEVFRIHSDLKEEEIRNKVIELMRELKLENPEELYKKYPHELSGGMLQRVNIAIAIALKPELLIADEPTTSIDKELKYRFLEILKDINEKYGTTIIFITHDMELVRNFSDEIVVMYLGEIVEKNDADSFFKNPLHPYSKSLLKSIPDKKTFNKRFYQIKGSVPDFKNKPAGCPFSGRCDFEFKDCANIKPDKKTVEGGYYYCLLKGENNGS